LLPPQFIEDARGIQAAQSPTDIAKRRRKGALLVTLVFCFCLLQANIGLVAIILLLLRTLPVLL